jgi:hypothetical protein
MENDASLPKPPAGFEIRLGKLTEEFQDKLSQAIGHYSVPLVVDIGAEYKFIGSGTLITFSGHFGILTAEHVVNYAADEKYRLNTKFGSSQKLRVSVAEFPHDISIDLPYLKIETSGFRKDDYYGPDLAFVKIPPSPLLSELRARKSFVDITVSTEKRFENASTNSGCIAVTGFPDVDRVQQILQSNKLGFTVLEGLKGYGFITGEENYEEHEAYDYLSLGVSYGIGGDVPIKFGGVSGGGVWRVPIVRKKGEPEGTEYFDKFYLAGVVFFQGEIVDNECHLRGAWPKIAIQTILPAT